MSGGVLGRGNTSGNVLAVRHDIRAYADMHCVNDVVHVKVLPYLQHQKLTQVSRMPNVQAVLEEKGEEGEQQEEGGHQVGLKAECSAVVEEVVAVAVVVDEVMEAVVELEPELVVAGEAEAEAASLVEVMASINTHASTATSPSAWCDGGLRLGYLPADMREHYFIYTCIFTGRQFLKFLSKR